MRTPKRCSFLTLIFIIKTLSQSLLIRLLRKDDQLALFRRLEQLSKKQINANLSIEFLRTCQNLNLTPTFAKVAQHTSIKWKKSSKKFSDGIITEEIRSHLAKNELLKVEINKIYDELRQTCSLVRYVCILHLMARLRTKYYQQVAYTHSKKIAKLMYRKTDVEKHITNISSYQLSFFEKLILCRGLKFAFPQKVSDLDIKASFEKLYWSLDPNLTSEHKELTAATLRSIALNYAQRKGPRMPKNMWKAVKRLRRRDDLVITKPDKGTGVVVMDKSHYLELLSKASVQDKSKFREISAERPKQRGRPPKHYHPLLDKEKHLSSVINNILPKSVAATLCPIGSRLAHLYGLPKTHKESLSLRPILSATHTYNFALAKWLDEKLKPLSVNEFTITDVFHFADEVRNASFDENGILVSYDVTSLFTNVPLHETITILADKAFEDNWFNTTYNLNIKKDDLINLLTVASKDQLFQFNGVLYEQFDGVAMGSPLGPLMANTFMCSIEDKLNQQGKLPPYYKRYVDDTLTVMNDEFCADVFLQILNRQHPSIKFTMEVANSNNVLPFLGMELIKKGAKVETKVYVKPTNTGLLLHHQSHVDSRYKKAILFTMLDRAFKLSSSWSYFSDECERLKAVFEQLEYPQYLVDSTISQYIKTKTSDIHHNQPAKLFEDTRKYRIVLPFKDQKSADTVRKQLAHLGNIIRKDLCPVFTSRKIGDYLKLHEDKPSVVNQYSVVYKFECDLCAASYVGYTQRHLFHRISEHKLKTSSIGRHVLEKHGLNHLNNECFKVLRRCKTRLDCLIYEMFLIKEHAPSLNIQSDSIRAKLFIS